MSTSSIIICGSVNLSLYEVLFGTTLVQGLGFLVLAAFQLLLNLFIGVSCRLYRVEMPKYCTSSHQLLEFSNFVLER